MAKHTSVLEKERPDVDLAGVDAVPTTLAEPLLREALGATLRGFREDSHRTLRELAVAANVSPGYLSELERGRKEVSSELLASVCMALGIRVSQVIIEAAAMMAFDAAAAELTAATPVEPVSVASH
ncbi:MAG: helix-turn-helix domain-containing protein [Corynebacterium sp.]|uniref:helix-turn-helix domain-containing protein n=1 Tax=unclassified Corynebacterium TaxID=2624378 RepID=UPI00095A00DB|nr:helix-turn-helix transcriptional regulator [Corynebacterium sp. CNJ-954]OLT54715.1 transcriptional regulator [Corynebacterium sp. CNJ-954]